MSEVINLRTGDNRAADFLEKLIQFIISEADGLPYPAVLGCIELARDHIKQQQRIDVLGE